MIWTRSGSSEAGKIGTRGAIVAFRQLLKLPYCSEKCR